MEERNENINELMGGVQSFILARNLAFEGKIAEAQGMIQHSHLPEEAKAKLLKALESNSHVIKVVFNDYALALGMAFCESCHGR